jgi:hypothetical protein
MKFLKSKYFSLTCAAINAAWSLNSFSNGELAWGVIGAGFCALCMRNYLTVR